MAPRKKTSPPAPEAPVGAAPAAAEATPTEAAAAPSSAAEVEALAAPAPARRAGPSVSETMDTIREKEATRLRAFHQARAQSSSRGRSGLTGDEIRRLVFHVREGKPWKDAVRLSLNGLVAPDVLERWKPEIERQAQEEQGRIKV